MAIPVAISVMVPVAIVAVFIVIAVMFPPFMFAPFALSPLLAAIALQSFIRFVAFVPPVRGLRAVIAKIHNRLMKAKFGVGHAPVAVQSFAFALGAPANNRIPLKTTAANAALPKMDFIRCLCSCITSSRGRAPGWLGFRPAPVHATRRDEKCCQ